MKWGKQNRFIDLRTLNLIVKYFKPTQATKRNAPVCAEDLFSCISLRTNGTELLPNYRQEGRHLFTNFLKHGLKKQEQQRQPAQEAFDFTIAEGTPNIITKTFENSHVAEAA